MEEKIISAIKSMNRDGWCEVIRLTMSLLYTDLRNSDGFPYCLNIIGKIDGPEDYDLNLQIIPNEGYRDGINYIDVFNL